jgi:hypothetical protein
MTCAANLNALFIDPRRFAFEKLKKSLEPEVFFITPVHVTSLQSALGQLISGEFQICFVTESLPVDSLKSFMKDLQGLRAKSDLRLVLVRQEEKGDIVCSSDDLDLVITEACSNSEKAQVIKVLQPTPRELEREKLKETHADLDSGIGRLMSLIDDAASETRRGKKVKLDRLVADFVSSLTGSDKGLLDHYFDTLTEKTEAVRAVLQKLDVPDEVLRKKLPGLSKDNYTGTSKRVWKRLLKKLGEKQ